MTSKVFLCVLFYDHVSTLENKFGKLGWLVNYKFERKQ